MITAWTILTLVSAGAFSAVLESDADGLVFSPQSAFRIPLDLTAEERSRLSSVRLFVSDDQGQTWRRQNDGSPQTEVLTYRAKHDGEYWFSVALVDQSGQQSPPDIAAAAPGLKIIVDTQKPTLAIKAIRSRSGRRGIRWSADDPNIMRSSIRLAVWNEESQTWLPYSVRHPDQELVWFEEHEEFTRIQASIFDRAGHESVIEVEVIGDQFSKRDVAIFALTQRSAPTAKAATSEPDSNAPPVRSVSHSLPMTPVTVCGSNHVAVNYVVDSSVTGAVGTAELWTTRDEGTTWRLAGVDSDAKSPINVQLEEDGLWGLKILVPETGTKTKGPSPGDPPEMYLEVDTQAPQVEVLPMEKEGDDIGIRWRVDDKNLDANPINVLFSASAKGPWKPIAIGVENSGAYHWKVDPELRGQTLFIRIEANDRAHHVGFGQTKEPIVP